jgi:hypothetical protein
MVIGDTTFLASVDLNIAGIEINRHLATQPCLPRWGTRSSIRRVTRAIPVSTTIHCGSVNLRASPAAVVDANPAPARSVARQRQHADDPHQPGNPPAICAAARSTSNSPAPNPRSRCLIGPTAASNAEITPSRSTTSVTAAIPDTDVRLGSGAPTRTPGRPPRKLSTRRMFSPGTGCVFATTIIPGQSGTYRHLNSVSPPYSGIRVR